MSPVPAASLPALLRGLPGRARTWPVASQQVARRNAMLACTELAAHRLERDEVAAYLAALPPPATRPAPRAARPRLTPGRRTWRAESAQMAGRVGARGGPSRRRWRVREKHRRA